MKNGKIRRLLPAALAAFAVLAAVSCGAGGTESETVPVTETEATAAETETAGTTADDRIGVSYGENGFCGWFDYGTALYSQRYTKYHADHEGAVDGVSFQMAKNEKEGFQYIVSAAEDVSGLRCEVTPLSDGAGHTLTGEVNVARYLYVIRSDGKHNKGFLPCMLLPQDDPFQGGTFDVAAGAARTLYVRYETDKDTVPGIYAGRLEIKKDGKTLLSGGVTVRVRDIYYDEKTECLTTIGVSYDPNDPSPVVNAGPDSAPTLEGGSEIQRIYAEFLLDHRMTSSDLPFPDGLLSEGAVDYMKNPRVTMVQLRQPQARGALRKEYEIAAENGLFDKLYFSYFDEPHKEEHIAHVLFCAESLHRLYPGFTAMDALLIDLPKDGRNIIERLSDVTTLYCPKVEFFTGRIRSTLLTLKQERGDRIFWYVCGAAGRNGVNLLPSTPGTDKRLLFWQQYQQEVDGFLYWRATFWNNHEDVWADDYMTGEREAPSGDVAPTDDGLLVYWHPETGMPVSTLGFEAIRDGIEDFQLMKMVEASHGRETVLSYVEQITTSPTKFVRYEKGSTPLLEDLKNQMFDLLDP